MSTITFADIVHQSVSFDQRSESGAIALKIIDSRWFQRLRDISQTANTRLVYMFSEHSRFGHSMGVAYLAELLLSKLSAEFPQQIEMYRTAIVAAALLHDIGHLAPGSHTAYKTWFPGQPDAHEELVANILAEDAELAEILGGRSSKLLNQVLAILSEDPKLPPWTWEILSGGGWNVDRGNWCIVDSIMAGVSYGHYNIAALTDSIQITADGHLGIRENRLDAMMHFAVSRHALYRQIYQHRVILSTDVINGAIVQRARDLGEAICFADPVMRKVLRAKTVDDLCVGDIFKMREPWWRYHLAVWADGSDSILADLADRLLHRRLFKTIRIPSPEDTSKITAAAREAILAAGFDPRYYLHEVATMDINKGDSRHSMAVVLDNGKTMSLIEADPLYKALVQEFRTNAKTWIVMPQAAKLRLGIER